MWALSRDHHLNQLTGIIPSELAALTRLTFLCVSSQSPMCIPSQLRFLLHFYKRFQQCMIVANKACDVLFTFFRRIMHASPAVIHATPMSNKAHLL